MNVIVNRKTRRSKWYILLVAGNGEPVAHTQGYFSKSNAVRAAKNIVDAANSETWALVVPR